MGQKIKSPLSHTDRGRKIYAVPPLVQLHLTVQPSRCPITPLAVSGDPVLPYCVFQAGHSGRYLGELFPLPCTTRQLSGGKGNAYLFPSTCLLQYPNKKVDFCQALFIFDCGNKNNRMWNIKTGIYIIRSSRKFPNEDRGMFHHSSDISTGPALY
jgi:hypothetical protein